jgi:hypothetical protein
MSAKPMNKPSELLTSEPDFSDARKNMDEIALLSAACGFDLFEALRLLSKAGAPVFCCDVDYRPAIATGHSVVRYQLSERLKALLTALRAENFNANEIERGARFRCMLSNLLEGLSHAET